MTSAPVRPALWREEIDQPLVCIGVRQETHDVMSFTLRADEPTWLRFDPVSTSLSRQRSTGSF